MDIDNEKNSSCSLNEHECGCDEKKCNEKDCCEDKSNEGCGCGCGCGCGDGPGNKYITIVLEDNSELECQVLGIFGRLSRVLCKPSRWCKIETLSWRF